MPCTSSCSAALDHLVHRAVVAEVDHLRAGGLQDAAHDVDRRVVAVEQARRGDEADLVLRLVDEALRLGQVGHDRHAESLVDVYVNVNSARSGSAQQEFPHRSDLIVAHQRRGVADSGQRQHLDARPQRLHLRERLAGEHVGLGAAQHQRRAADLRPGASTGRCRRGNWARAGTPGPARSRAGCRRSPGRSAGGSRWNRAVRRASALCSARCRHCSSVSGAEARAGFAQVGLHLAPGRANEPPPAT